MKAKWMGILVCSGLTAFSLGGHHTLRDMSLGEGKTVTVRKGDTVSYLAIKIYGIYTPAIGDSIARANPHLRDINRIQVGQVIHFPALDSARARIELRAAAGTAVVTYLEGAVQFEPRSAPSWQPLHVNAILKPGDRVRTAEAARAELVLDNRSVLRLSENSELTLIDLAPETKTTKPASILGISLGGVWAKVSGLFASKGDFQLRLPTAIAGVQGTVYRASVAADSAAVLRVYQGTVQVRGGTSVAKPRSLQPRQVPGPRQVGLEEWIRIVRAMQEIRIPRQGVPSEPQQFRDEGIDAQWVDWNKSRDADFEQKL